MRADVFPPSNQTHPYWVNGIGWSNPNFFAWNHTDGSPDVYR